MWGRCAVATEDAWFPVVENSGHCYWDFFACTLFPPSDTQQQQPKRPQPLRIELGDAVDFAGVSDTALVTSIYRYPGHGRGATVRCCAVAGLLSPSSQPQLIDVPATSALRKIASRGAREDGEVLVRLRKSLFENGQKHELRVLCAWPAMDAAARAELRVKMVAAELRAQNGRMPKLAARAKAKELCAAVFGSFSADADVGSSASATPPVKRRASSSLSLATTDAALGVVPTATVATSTDMEAVTVDDDLWLPAVAGLIDDAEFAAALLPLPTHGLTRLRLGAIVVVAFAVKSRTAAIASITRNGRTGALRIGVVCPGVFEHVPPSSVLRAAKTTGEYYAGLQAALVDWMKPAEHARRRQVLETWESLDVRQREQLRADALVERLRPSLLASSQASRREATTLKADVESLQARNSSLLAHLDVAAKEIHELKSRLAQLLEARPIADAFSLEHPPTDIEAALSSTESVLARVEAGVSRLAELNQLGNFSALT